MYAQSGPVAHLQMVQVDLGSVPKVSGYADVTLSISAVVGKEVRVTQAVGPYTGKGTLPDESEMDGLIASGKVTGTNTLRIYWNANGFVRGFFKFAFNINQ